MSTPDVLVLGGSDTGKTHFAGQLLGRMRHGRQGKLRLRPGGVDDLSKLDEVLRCLEDGYAAGHTPAETWTGVRCALATPDGTDRTLEWPEYAGERLFDVVERRLLPAEWRTSIHGATGWLLFIRPELLKLHEDLLVRPIGTTAGRSDAEEPPVESRGWDDRARFVELLQMFLYATGQSTYRRSTKPRLAIVLSCWDELADTHRTPEDLLFESLPLLDSFVRSTWESDSWSVWGLSSLGRALRKDVRDADFAKKGPENHGYVVAPGGAARDPDLTAPVAWLLGV